MVGIYDRSRKRKVVACVTIYKQTNFRRAESYRNEGSFSQPMMHHLYMKMNVICLVLLSEYPVVTKSYNHEFFKSNLVSKFSQNNAVENYRKYQKKQGSTIIMAWSLIIMEWSR